ncbi:hypothetical protein CANMA_004708 [Candida margitis]|uniref:uncharacterized protein n=1 Tax=Candida margitis TaxID=1775924 RepID=UPI002227A456|nr:uncharacterized protein CANMA_004708 [Candida margitis]KAI5953870.1 hypothetical protein CANMA_004708 [Candida margitis]
MSKIPKHREFSTDSDPFRLEDNFMTDESMPHYDPNAPEDKSMQSMPMMNMDKKIDEMKDFTTGVSSSLHDYKMPKMENNSKSMPKEKHEEPVDDLLNFLG